MYTPRKTPQSRDNRSKKKLAVVTTKISTLFDALSMAGLRDISRRIDLVGPVNNASKDTLHRMLMEWVTTEELNKVEEPEEDTEEDSTSD